MSPESPRLDLTSLRDALAALQRALTRWQGTDAQDEELRDACIQRFETTFELSWKLLQRRLELDFPDARYASGCRHGAPPMLEITEVQLALATTP